MQSICRVLVGVVLAIGISAPAWAQEVVHYHRPSSDLDVRYDYHIALLSEALKRTEAEYGPAVARPSERRMSQQRLMFMLEEGHAGVDVAVSPTDRWRETRLTPVRIPLDKGLLGWRVFIVRAGRLEELARVRSVEELKRYTVGQGTHWVDVPVYRSAGFDVQTGNRYEGLFAMLSLDRFDIFPRGVEEAYAEVSARRRQYPDLRVERTLVLHYPFVRYFWVANSQRGDMLRERITKGLELMLADGTFDRIFHEYKDLTLEVVRLHERRVLRIPNPFLPKSVPLDRPELWYDPLSP